LGVVVTYLILETEVVIIIVQIREAQPTTESGTTTVMNQATYILGFVNTYLVLSKSNGMV